MNRAPWGNEQQQGISSKGERLEVRSGQVLAIDQFMLGNPQVLSRLEALVAAGDPTANSAEVTRVVTDYGGCIVALPAGTYRVLRSAEKQAMCLCSDDIRSADEEEERIEEVLTYRKTAPTVGRIYIETRCIVLADVSLLEDRELLTEYSRLRRANQEKEARDLLREHGAAVRYGFNKRGDVLAVVAIDRNTIALWADSPQHSSSDQERALS